MTLVLVIASKSLRMARLKGELENNLAEVPIGHPPLCFPSMSAPLMKLNTLKINISFTSLIWL